MKTNTDKAFIKTDQFLPWAGDNTQREGYLVAILGPHGSGKTTLGRKVAGQLGCRFDEEIGRVFRESALVESVNNHALVFQPKFDQKVIQAELERDVSSGFPRVVETWHPGNFAYAQKRSPEIARIYENVVRAMIRKMGQPLLVQPLRISLETSLQRLSEPGSDDPNILVNFFRKVAQRAEHLAEGMGLTILEPVYTDELNEEETLKVVVDNLSSHGILTSNS